jgi:type VI protein secretion system component Hcp
MAIGDNFMWIPEGGGVAIEGESSDTYFKSVKAFEVSNFSFTIKNDDPTVGTGKIVSLAGKGKFQECQIDKLMDSASVPLYKACSLGTMIPTLMLAVRKASGGGGLLYVQYIFRYNQVTGITWGGGTGSEGATEKVSFSFKAMGVQYIAQLQDGRQGKRQAWSWSTAKQEEGVGSPSLDLGPDYPQAPPFMTGHTRDMKH